MQSLFKSITFPDDDQEKVKQNLHQGKAIQLVKHTYELGDYRQGDIMKTPWNELVVLSKVQTYDKSNANQSVFGKSLYEKYGNVDVLDIMSICSLIYFIPTPPYERNLLDPDRYCECGMIKDNLVYHCNGFKDRSIKPFEQRESEFLERRTVFLHSQVDTTSLVDQYYVGPPAIEYVLRATGFVRRKTLADLGKISGDRYFKKYEDLYRFFKRRRRF